MNANIDDVSMWLVGLLAVVVALTWYTRAREDRSRIKWLDGAVNLLCIAGAITLAWWPISATLLLLAVALVLIEQFTPMGGHEASTPER